MSRFVLSKRVVLVNSASSAASILLNLTVIVWLQQYLLRRISAEEYSLLPVVMSIMAFAPLVTTVLTGGIGRYVTSAYARGDDDEVTRICSTMFPLLLLGSLGVLGIGGACAWYIDRLLTIGPEQLGDARLMLSVLVLSAAVRLPCSLLGNGFVVRQRLLLQDLIEVGSQLVRVVLLFALLFGVSTRVLWVVVASATGDLFSFAVGTPISMRLLPSLRVRWRSFHWPLARELISYGGWTLVTQVAETLRVAMDPLLLNEFARSLDVATFQVAGMAPRMLPMLVTPLARPFIPVFAALHATADWDRLRSTFLRTSRYHSWVILTVCIPAVAFNREFMLLYVGETYAAAGTVMSILLVVPVLSALNALGPASLAAAGEVRPYAVRQVVVQGASSALSVLFVVVLGWGAVGSATAIAIAAGVLLTALVWPLSWRVSRADAQSWLREVLLPVALPTVPSVLLCLVVKYAFGITTWTGLLGWSVASASLYLGLVATFALRAEDRRDLATAMRYAWDRAKAIFGQFHGP